MPEQSPDSDTPAFLKHCVADVAKQDGKDVDSAFAICVDNFQEHGYLKKGSLEMTKKGQKRHKEKQSQDNHEDKMDEYESLLKQAREGVEVRTNNYTDYLVESIDGMMLRERLKGF